jgi:hypothetical protein
LVGVFFFKLKKEVLIDCMGKKPPKKKKKKKLNLCKEKVATTFLPRWVLVSTRSWVAWTCPALFYLQWN